MSLAGAEREGCVEGCVCWGIVGNGRKGEGDVAEGNGIDGMGEGVGWKGVASGKSESSH